jgi:hypothetical protein
MEPKFKIDQLVKQIGDLDKDGGKILGYSFSPATGFIYTISSKSIDFDKKEVIDGVITLAENEIELVCAVSEEPEVKEEVKNA